MGKRGKEIIGLKVDELVEMFNKALADEWLAYYQYWIGAKLLRGPMREEVLAELEEHAADELRHAGMLVDRILQLKGTPILKPEDWYKVTNCGYKTPEDPSTGAIVEQNIKGEQCAIDVYNSMLEITKEKDPISYTMVLEILRDEVEHEDDLERLLEDIEGRA